jgi:5-deoxy-glucuronate isomerase
MLYKNKKIKDSLTRVFDYGGFSLCNFQSSAGSEFRFDRSNHKERLAFSLSGEIQVNGQDLDEKDIAYLPIGSDLEISSKEASVVFVAETEGERKYEPYVKKYKEATRMPVGKETFRRTVVVSVGEKDPANKFIAGYVEDSLGEWSSYPPHKHDGKPEAYIFYGIDPGFSIQVLLQEDKEQAFVVHDYDSVLIENGYHPHVSTSLTGTNYAWIISAPPHNRNLGVEIHPSFQEVNLGKSHLTIKND